MKKLVFVFLSLLLSINVYSQNILDFFQEVPDSSVLNLTREQRIRIIRNSAENTNPDNYVNFVKINNNSYGFSVLDVKNGYLKLVGTFEGHLQMCYWNLKNGNKLIAIYQEHCGPVCYVHRFDFYTYNGKEYIYEKTNNIIPDIKKDFFGDDYEKKIKKLNDDDVIATLLFDLPQKGKNIIAKWGNEDEPETYKRYGILGNRMVLIWNDGKFEKGEIYWEK